MNLSLCVSNFDAAHQGVSHQLALRLGLPLESNAPKLLPEGKLCLFYDEYGLSIQPSGKKAHGPVRVDFVTGASQHRRLYGGGKSQMIAKAVGLDKKRPHIWDMTAGLGGDGFVLASLGCRVTLFERHPIVAELLQDGLNRLRLDEQMSEIATRLNLISGDSLANLSYFEDELAHQSNLMAPEVIYLDPMFPHTDSSAKVKKEMMLFRELVGKDDDADLLLPQALEKAVNRVVVKRPRKAPFLNQKAPTYQLMGKANRFDIYALKAFD